MLAHPTLDQLHALGLQGMAKAFVDADASPESGSLTRAEWLALLLDREMAWRIDKRQQARMRYAKLRQQATPEDVDYRAPRGLDRALFQKLLVGEWIGAHEGVLICGPTGIGKSCWRARSATRPAGSIARCSMSASRDSFRIWRWRAATGAMGVSCALSAASTC